MRLRRLLAATAAGLAVAAAVLAFAPTESDDEPRAVAAAPAGRAVYARLGCGSCHRLAAAGSTATFGPSLDERLQHHDAASLRKTILDPPESIMPEDFGSRTTEAELDALVAFLLDSRR